MKQIRNRRKTLAFMLVALGLSNGLSASQIPGSVSGTVTAAPGGDYVTVGGKTYHLASTIPGAASLPGLHVGDVVQVWFNGPPADASSRVISIENRSASRH